VREELEATSEIPKLTAFRGKEGKTRPRHVLARTTRETNEASEAPRKLGDEAPQRLLTAREVIRQAARVEADARKEAVSSAPDLPPDALVEVHQCDFRQMPVVPGSARLIFTDPLYHREHLPLYSELAAWAAKVLQPGGLLVTYLGTSFLPEVVSRLGQHLTYVWTCSAVFAGERTTIHDRHIRTGWKPLLVYSNGPYQPADWTTDVITRPKEKRLHRFQQPELDAEFVIRRLTKEQDVILDPFCGSGTTAAVCKRLNRRCVTTDIDPNAVAITRGRVRATRVADPLVRPTIMTARMPMEDDDPDFEPAVPLGLPA
jgi:site-specific DNA-methyltransferase (adenine-specific)